jgi:hypothetical protein
MKIGRFPEVVNENAARVVASIVTVSSIIAVLFPSYLTIIPLLYGFLARVLYGPDYSPTAQLVLRGIIPMFKISNKPTAGIPKRFAQFIGLIFSISALLFFSFNLLYEFQITISILAFFAFLEASLGFCAGCYAFSLLIKWGIVPEETCERCNNLQFNK